MSENESRSYSARNAEIAPVNALLPKQDDYSISESECQSSCFSEVKELSEKFISKHLLSDLLADSYFRIGKKDRFLRVRDCGTFLEFSHEVNSDGVISEKGKLYSANFCKDRFCPMCSWRRSYKIFAQVSQIMDLISYGYEFLFLTLTMPSVCSDSLSDGLKRLNFGFKLLSKSKCFKMSVRGYFKALEITRNKDTGLYHPHFHIVLAVPKDYFKKFYIKHSEWLNMWRSAMDDFSITQVDVRKVYAKNLVEGKEYSKALASAVAEVSKYAVKSSDYLFPSDKQLTDKVLQELLSGIKSHSRFCTFGGVFAEVKRQLNLDDVEDGDLVHIEDEKINSALSYFIVRYGWSSGCYKMVSSHFKEPK